MLPLKVMFISSNSKLILWNSFIYEEFRLEVKSLINAVINHSAKYSLCII